MEHSQLNGKPLYIRECTFIMNATMGEGGQATAVNYVQGEGSGKKVPKTAVMLNVWAPSIKLKTVIYVIKEGRART